MHTLKNKMIPTKVIIICILCSVVACDCKACRNPRTTPTPQGTEPTSKILTPITDEMIAFASNGRHTFFLRDLLTDLKNDTPTNINKINPGTLYPSSVGYSALHQAALSLPDTDPALTKAIIKALLDRGANVNVQAENLDETPLHLAARLNKPAAVEALLEGGADVNAKNTDHKTPLNLAVNPAIRKFLTEHGAT